MNPLVYFPNEAECILPQSRMDFDSLAECSIHRDFRGSQQVRGIGAESIVVKGAVHLLSLRSGHDLAREMREMKRATVARTAFLKNSKCTATTLISWIADLLGPRVHQTMVREMHETRNPPQTVPSRSHRA